MGSPRSGKKGGEEPLESLTIFLTCYNVDVPPKPSGLLQGALAKISGQVEIPECQIRVDRMHLQRNETYFTEIVEGPNPVFALGIQIPLRNGHASPAEDGRASLTADILNFTLIRTQDNYNFGSASVPVERLVSLVEEGGSTEYVPFEIYAKVNKVGVDPALRITVAHIEQTEHTLISTQKQLTQAYSFPPAAQSEQRRKIALEEVMEPDYETSIPAMFLDYMYKELQIVTQLWNIRCQNERKKQLSFETPEGALAAGCDVFEVIVRGARNLKADHSVGFTDAVQMNPYVCVEFGETVIRADSEKTTDMVTVGRTMTELGTNDPTFSRQRASTLTARSMSLPPSKPVYGNRSASTLDPRHQSAESPKEPCASSFTFFRESHADTSSKGAFVFKVFHEIAYKKDPTQEDFAIGQCVVRWNITKPLDSDEEYNFAIDQWVSIYPTVDRRGMYDDSADLGKLHVQIRIKCSTVPFSLQSEAAYRQVEKTPLFRLADYNKDHKLRKMAKKSKGTFMVETAIADFVWHVKTLEMYLYELQKMLEHVRSKRAANATFRSSVMKKEKLWQPLATNLHLSYFTTFKEKEPNASAHVTVDHVRVTVTCGAPTAHGLSEKYGLLDLEDEMMEAKPSFYKTKHVYIYRKILCVSQSLSVLVTSFMALFEQCIKDIKNQGETILNQWAKIGFLFQWESLVSSQGKEYTMLNDCWIAIKTLGRFCFKFVRQVPGGSRAIYLQTTEDQKSYILHVPVPEEVYNILPNVLQQGQLIAVVPVLFSQGINEMQTVANIIKSSDVELQHKINLICAKTLENYASEYIQTEAATPEDMGMIRCMIETLKEVLNEETLKIAKKNYRVLLVAGDLARILHGGRVTFCKSGKDRTAMAITLEQTRMVHGTSSEKADMYDTIKPIANVMREFGVRIRIAEKNVGKARYTFNGLQRKMLPKVYRPPLRSIQSGMADLS
ncbi:unnamed protein product [Aphanomyces euteiches]|uniref:Uncharacterized protein n=2 Tax=Aphanomyces euteiches TaxID=100861 RepID=A0A6G0XWU0_9STRA|nr:hypothetical protein Ae201684_000582 [Aphanomyces euteiches]KAH9091589.1 hypothetical protein Ae201684P_011133 [Aphanomyces euteiches]